MCWHNGRHIAYQNQSSQPGHSHPPHSSRSNSNSGSLPSLYSSAHGASLPRPHNLADKVQGQLEVRASPRIAQHQEHIYRACQLVERFQHRPREKRGGGDLDDDGERKAVLFTLCMLCRPYSLRSSPCPYETCRNPRSMSSAVSSPCQYGALCRQPSSPSQSSEQLDRTEWNVDQQLPNLPCFSTCKPLERWLEQTGSVYQSINSCTGHRRGCRTTHQVKIVLDKIAFE